MKITIIGTSKVGKTSIVKKVFEYYSDDLLKEIRPTVGRVISKSNLEWINKTFIIQDIGGQKVYFDNYVDEDMFKSQDLVVVVVDVYEPQSDITHAYFNKIIEILTKLAVKPQIAFFIHKYDPEIYSLQESNPQRWEIVSQNVFLYTKFCQENFGPFSPTLFLTSIYNNSLFEAFLTLIMRTSQFEALKFGLDSFDYKTWKLLGNDLETDLSYIEDKAEVDGMELRKKWLEIILLNLPLSNKPAIFSGYNVSQKESTIFMIINCDAFQLNIPYNKQKVIQNYFINFVKTIWLLVENISIENDRITFLLKKI